VAVGVDGVVDVVQLRSCACRSTDEQEADSTAVSVLDVDVVGAVPVEPQATLADEQRVSHRR